MTADVYAQPLQTVTFTYKRGILLRCIHSFRHSMHAGLENIALPMNDHPGAALSDACRRVMSARLKPYNRDGTVEDRQPVAR